MEFLLFADEQSDFLKAHTGQDQALQLLIKDWPEKLDDVPTELLLSCSFREELLFTDGIIFKGQRIVTPCTLCARVHDLLHIGHGGIDATMRHSMLEGSFTGLG